MGRDLHIFGKKKRICCAILMVAGFCQPAVAQSGCDERLVLASDAQICVEKRGIYLGLKTIGGTTTASIENAVPMGRADIVQRAQTLCLRYRDEMTALIRSRVDDEPIWRHLVRVNHARSVQDEALREVETQHDPETCVVRGVYTRDGLVPE